MNGWEIDDHANAWMQAGAHQRIQAFVAAYGPCAAYDATTRTLVVVRRYEPGLNSAPEDALGAAGTFTMGLAWTTELASTYVLLPKTLTYRAVKLEPLPGVPGIVDQVPAGGLRTDVSVVFEVEDAGVRRSVRSNVDELRRLLPNHSDDRASHLEEDRLRRNFAALDNALPASAKPIPITSTSIVMRSLGTLVPSQFEDWWTAHALVPLVGTTLPITFADFNPDDPTQRGRLAKADAAAAAFLALGPADLAAAAQRVLKHCHEAIDSVGEEDWNREMARCTDPQGIWRFVRPTEVFLHHDEGTKRVYVSLLCKCDWEQAHGLQLVYRDGRKLTRVSGQDGHLFEDD